MSYFVLEDEMNKNNKIYFRNKSWKPECVWSFNMDINILKHILPSMNYFDSDV